MTCFNSSYMFNMIILGWCFLYRLSVIQNGNPWILQPWNFRLLSLISIVLAAYIVGICTLAYPNDRADQLFHEEMLAVTQFDLTDVGYIGGELTIDGKWNIPLCVAFSSYLIFLTITSGLLAICWFKIGSKLRGIRNISGANYRFQKKLYILLTLQTTLPIIFNFIPGGIIMILGITNSHCENVVLFCAMVLSFAQLCDPIFTVLLVTDYKRCVVHFLRMTFGFTSLPSSTTNSVAPVQAGTKQAS